MRWLVFIILLSPFLALSQTNLLLPASTSTTGQIKINGKIVLHTYGVNNYFAAGAGNFVMQQQGTSNIGIGLEALSKNLLGDYNTAIGHYAGKMNRYGRRNIFLGYNAGNNSVFADLSDRLIIDNTATGTPFLYGNLTAGARKLTINADLTVTGDSVKLTGIPEVAQTKGLLYNEVTGTVTYGDAGAGGADTLYVQYECLPDMTSGMRINGDTIWVDTCYIHTGDELWELIGGHLQPANEVDSAWVKIIKTDTISSYSNDSLYYESYIYDTLTGLINTRYSQIPPMYFCLGGDWEGTTSPDTGWCVTATVWCYSDITNDTTFDAGYDYGGIDSIIYDPINDWTTFYFHGTWPGCSMPSYTVCLGQGNHYKGYSSVTMQIPIGENIFIPVTINDSLNVVGNTHLQQDLDVVQQVFTPGITMNETVGYVIGWDSITGEHIAVKPNAIIGVDTSFWERSIDPESHIHPYLFPKNTFDDWVGIQTNEPLSYLTIGSGIFGDTTGLTFSDGVSKLYLTDVGEYKMTSNSYPFLQNDNDSYYYTYLGYNAGSSISSADSYSTGFGHSALAANTGSESIGIGVLAGGANDGSSVIAIGNNSMKLNDGSNCIGIGNNSMYLNDGDYSIGIGIYSLYWNTKEHSNGLGYYSLYYNEGDHANGFGTLSFRQNTGDNSVGFGDSTLIYADGDSNIAVGNSAFNKFNINISGQKTFNSSDFDTGEDVITIVGHNFGSAGEYINLFYEQGTVSIPQMQDSTVYMFFIINDSMIAQKKTINIGSPGIGTGHKLTPQYTYSNSIAIGYDAEPTASNQIMLGNINTEETYVNGDLTVTGLDSAAYDYQLYYDKTTGDITYDSAGSGTGANLWSISPPASDTIKTDYNVVVDSSFAMKYNGNYFGLVDSTLNVTKVDFINLKLSGLAVMGDTSNTVMITSTNMGTGKVSEILLDSDWAPRIFLRTYDTQSESFVDIDANQVWSEGNGDKYKSNMVVDTSVITMQTYYNNVSKTQILLDTTHVEITADSTIINGDLTVTGLDSASYDYQLYYDKTTGDITYDSAGSGTGANLWTQAGDSLYPTTLTNKVGIGTATPTEMLDVSGNISAGGWIGTGDTNMILKKGGNPFIHVTPYTTPNLFIGETAGNINTVSSYNIGIGTLALYSLDTGMNNVAVGYDALSVADSSYDNVAIGKNAMNSMPGCNNLNRNTVIGRSAGEAIKRNSSDNTLIGDHAGANSGIGGNGNTAIGSSAATSLATGYANTVLGYKAGFSNVSGDSNIFIGNKAGYNETGSNKLYIENSNADSTHALVFGNFGIDRFTINGTFRMEDNVHNNYIGSNLSVWNSDQGVWFGTYDNATYQSYTKAQYDGTRYFNYIQSIYDTNSASIYTDATSNRPYIYLKSFNGDIFSQLELYKDTVVVTSELTKINGPLTVTDVLILPVKTRPGAGSEVSGMIYHDADTHLYFWNGTTWKQLD